MNEIRTTQRDFVLCDNHPGAGGSHQSRGLVVNELANGATLWMCTHRSRKGTVCGSLQLELPPPVGWLDGLTADQRWRNHYVVFPALVAAANEAGTVAP